MASLVGTLLISRAIQPDLRVTLVGIRSIMAALALALALLGTSAWAVAGLLGTGGPVAWGTCLTQMLPEVAEAGGGLQVAVIQLAITLGAATGGLVLDTAGPVASFAISAAILALAALAGSRAIPRGA